MKSVKFFAMFVAAAVFALSSCEKTPEGGEQGGNETALGTAAELESLTLVSGDISIDGFFTGKTVEIAYRANQYDALAEATATVKISDGATIEPDPATPRDYTVNGGVTFTVTSEDGNTTNEYTVTLIEAVSVITGELTWDKSVGELGLPTYSYANVGVAFSGTHIVTYDAQVFDLTGAPVGKLNLTGVEGSDAEGFQLAALTNDNNGVLVASVGLDASGAYVPSNPTQTRFYAWMDGYDSAPTLIQSDSANNFCVYMSVAGDVKGDAVLTFVAGRGATQMHHVWLVKNGDWENKVWSSVTTQYPGNDGNWGQALSFFDGTNDGAAATSPFIVCDSRGSNEGIQVLYMENGIETRLMGSLEEGELAGFGDLYGNYSTGSAKALLIDGVPYVAVASSGWTQVYLTIQPVDPNADYIIPTVAYSGAEVFPSVGAYYDTESGNVYVAMLSPNNQIVLYTVSVQYV